MNQDLEQKNIQAKEENVNIIELYLPEENQNCTVTVEEPILKRMEVDEKMATRFMSAVRGLDISVPKNLIQADGSNIQLDTTVVVSLDKDDNIVCDVEVLGTITLEASKRMVIRMV